MHIPSTPSYSRRTAPRGGTTFGGSFADRAAAAVYVITSSSLTFQREVPTRSHLPLYPTAPGICQLGRRKPGWSSWPRRSNTTASSSNASACVSYPRPTSTPPRSLRSEPSIYRVRELHPGPLYLHPDVPQRAGVQGGRVAVVHGYGLATRQGVWRRQGVLLPSLWDNAAQPRRSGRGHSQVALGRPSIQRLQ